MDNGDFLNLNPSKTGSKTGTEGHLYVGGWKRRVSLARWERYSSQVLKEGQG